MSTQPQTSGYGSDVEEKDSSFENPTDLKSDFIKQIKALLPENERGTKNVLEANSDNLSDKILSILGTVSPSSDLNYLQSENLYNKLRKNPSSRSRLENVHSARAFKYGHTSFGPKFWYKESHEIAKKFKSQKIVENSDWG